MYCRCGCGKKVKERFFIRGHIDIWIKNHANILCGCGCGQYISIKKYRPSALHRRGFPRFIHNHHMNTPEYRANIAKYNMDHLGEQSNRWVKDRSKVRDWRKNFLYSQKKAIYVRDEGICKSCGAFTLLDAHKYDPLKANFDHIIPIKDGGKNELDNGQTLCLICHKLKHSAKAKSANSVKPKPIMGMAIPNQAEINSPACVETNVQTSKEMI